MVGVLFGEAFAVVFGGACIPPVSQVRTAPPKTPRGPLGGDDYGNYPAPSLPPEPARTVPGGAVPESGKYLQRASFLGTVRAACGSVTPFRRRGRVSPARCTHHPHRFIGCSSFAPFTVRMFRIGVVNTRIMHIDARIQHLLWCSEVLPALRATDDLLLTQYPVPSIFSPILGWGHPHDLAELPDRVATTPPADCADNVLY